MTYSRVSDLHVLSYAHYSNGKQTQDSQTNRAPWFQDHDEILPVIINI
jgi:hypothetical protein